MPKIMRAFKNTFSSILPKGIFETFKTESLIEKGIKAAGPRARKSTLELEKLLKKFRKVSVEESKI